MVEPLLCVKVDGGVGVPIKGDRGMLFEVIDAGLRIADQWLLIQLGGVRL